MVTNAKAFNEKTSEIFADAERIRKALAAFMTKRNPAYRDPTYRPFPTPLPGEGGAPEGDIAIGEADADGETDTEAPAGKTQRLSTFVGSASTPATATNGRTASSTPVVEDAVGAGESFVGDTFQIAQEKLMTELIHLKDDEYE